MQRGDELLHLSLISARSDPFKTGAKRKAERIKSQVIIGTCPDPRRHGSMQCSVGQKTDNASRGGPYGPASDQGHHLES